jgi:uncharacterized Zn ribbon protein
MACKLRWQRCADFQQEAVRVSCIKRDEEEIECNADKVEGLVLKTYFLKKFDRQE